MNTTHAAIAAITAALLASCATARKTTDTHDAATAAHEETATATTDTRAESASRTDTRRTGDIIIQRVEYDTQRTDTTTGRAPVRAVTTAIMRAEETHTKTDTASARAATDTRREASSEILHTQDTKVSETGFGSPAAIAAIMTAANIALFTILMAYASKKEREGRANSKDE